MCASTNYHTLLADIDIQNSSDGMSSVASFEEILSTDECLCVI